jgi:hypothetical protein
LFQLVQRQFRVEIVYDGVLLIRFQSRIGETGEESDIFRCLAHNFRLLGVCMIASNFMVKYEKYSIMKDGVCYNHPDPRGLLQLGLL